IEELAAKLLEADPDFYLIGEYWNGDYASLENYMNETSFDIDLFDVKLHQNFKAASEAVDGFDMSSLLDDTLLQKNPTLAIPFV
ncbi:hypothetical protein QP363_13295, partial [Corynebacterium sp. UMB6689]|nr:hypothetical protein [Corynebacterium sp. UMB6689]